MILIDRVLERAGTTIVIAAYFHFRRKSVQDQRGKLFRLFLAQSGNVLLLPMIAALYLIGTVIVSLLSIDPAFTLLVVVALIYPAWVTYWRILDYVETYSHYNARRLVDRAKIDLAKFGWRIVFRSWVELIALQCVGASIGIGIAYIARLIYTLVPV